jgi:hypothetical protein
MFSLNQGRAGTADTFTRATAAILFTCEVPSRQHHGILKKSHYALQDRDFRLFTHPNTGSFEQIQATGANSYGCTTQSW